MATRSDKSKSFMREHELIGIANEDADDDEGFYIDEKGAKQNSKMDLEYWFKKTDNKKLLFYKKTLLQKTKEYGMNRQVVVNAINLQDYPLSHIKKIIKNLTNALKKEKIKGVLEFHANDTTQSSYHFHFWTWQLYEERARLFLTEYMLEKGYASMKNVQIEGLYKKTIDEDIEDDEKYKIIEENKNSKIQIEEEVEEEIIVPKRNRLDELKQTLRTGTRSGLFKSLEDGAKNLYKDLAPTNTKKENSLDKYKTILKQEPYQDNDSLKELESEELKKINERIEKLMKKLNMK